MTIVLIRHAPTPSNLRSCYLGKRDEDLAPEGLALARAAKGNHDISRVYTSTLARTVQTAAILYPDAERISHPDLREMDFGDFEGKHWRDLETHAQYRAWVESGCELPCPGGESKASFTARCCQAFSSIVCEQQGQGVEKLAFVIHGGTIMAIMSTFVQPRRDYFAWKAGFCGGFVLASTTEDTCFTLVESVPSPWGESQEPHTGGKYHEG